MEQATHTHAGGLPDSVPNPVVGITKDFSVLKRPQLNASHFEKTTGKKPTDVFLFADPNLKLDPQSEFNYAKRFIEEAFVAYAKAFPNELKEVALACHQLRAKALNGYQATSKMNWRLSMIIPVGLDAFIKKHVPGYLQHTKLRRWMMKTLKGFCVPDRI